MFLEVFQLPFMQRALVAVILLAIVAAAFGIFVVMGRMAFFADAVAHASLAGIALGIVFGIAPTITAVATAIIIAIGIAAFTGKSRQSLDTVIGIFYAIALSLGVILLSKTFTYRANLSTYLFGDILAVGWDSVFIMAGITALVLVVLAWKGKQLILMQLEPDLARVEGVPFRTNRYIFMILLALIVAIGIKVAGIILIGPLLIIPAATAKNITTGIRLTMIFSLVIALASGIFGLLFSYVFSVPTGPMIVALAGAFFFLSHLASGRTQG